MVVVRLSSALPSLVVCSKTEAKILDSGNQCKIRLNAATKYGQLYTETQRQWTGVVCSKMLESIYVSRQRQLHEVVAIVSGSAVSFTKGEILESDDQRKTDRHHEI